MCNWPFTHNHSPHEDSTFPFRHYISSNRERLAKISQTKKFNSNCDAVPITKTAKIDITTKLQILGLEPVDVPADGNCFLHAARFALIQQNDWKQHRGTYGGEDT